MRILKVVMACLLVQLTPLLQAEELIYAKFDRFGEQKAKEVLQLSLAQALKETLDHQWKISIAEDALEVKAANYLESQGAFNPFFKLSLEQDWGNTYSEQLGLDFPKTPGHTYEYDRLNPFVSNKLALAFSVRQQLRQGTHWELQALASKEKNTLFSYYDPFPTLTNLRIPYQHLGQAPLSFKLTQPLLRDFLVNAASNNEKVAALQLDAAKSTFVYTLSEDIVDTIKGYWGLVAAHQAYEIYFDAYRQVEKYSQDVKRLIATKQVAEIEGAESRASLDRAYVAMIEARAVMQTQVQELQLLIGRQDQKLYLELPFILDKMPLPPKEKQAISEFEDFISFAVEAALYNREDYKALSYLLKASRVYTAYTKQNLQPNLDLEFSAALSSSLFNGRNSNLFSASHMRHSQRSASVALAFSMPLFNDEAKGMHRKAKAQNHSMEMLYQLKKHQIKAKLLELMELQRSISVQWMVIQDSIKENKLYELGQEKLFKNGQSTMFQLLDSHTKLVAKRLDLNEITLKYANNLAEIHFQIGSLVSLNYGDHVEIASVKSLPKKRNSNYVSERSSQ